MPRKALKLLMRRDEPTREEDIKSHEALYSEGDRVVAIIGASFVESALKRAIVRYLNKGISRNKVEELFVFNGPLDRFSSKIKIGHALGIYNSRVQADLDCVREIRNVYAHTSLHVKFDTREVADACKGLHLFSILNDEDKLDLSPRHIYTNSVIHLETFLLRKSTRRRSASTDPFEHYY